MKIIAPLIVFVMLTGMVASAQTKVTGQVLLSENFEYLHFLSDSMVWTSIGEEQDSTSYYISNDTLFIQHQYWQSGPNQGLQHFILWQDYKITRHNNDSLYLVSSPKANKLASNWQDTFKFVSDTKRREAISKFRYLKLHYNNPFDGGLILSIDSAGKIIYERWPRVYIGERVLTRTKGEFTREEFANFLDALAAAVPSGLAPQRNCGIDGASKDFEIAYNDKTIISAGCSLKWPHAFLFNYLYSLNKNKGFVKRKKG